MQAAVQKYVDSAISKTINVPVELPFEDFKDIYTLAYESGCKGCTTYRPNEITGAVLERKPKTGWCRPRPSCRCRAAPRAQPEDVSRRAAWST
jgi:ribonucleoside-diphosphate reductase alpha chain